MAKKSFFVCLSLLMISLQAAVAAPTLRLTIPDSLRLQNGDIKPVWIATGTNGPTNLSVEAFNSGDGTLNLSVNGGTAAWLKPTVQGTQPCSTNTAKTCTIVRVLFETSALSAGTYQGDVIIEDANAVDAPQRVPIKIYVGGNVPSEVNLYLRPAAGSADWVEFESPETPSKNQITTLTAQPAGLVTVSTSGNGSFQFLYTHRISTKYVAGMAVASTSGTATVARSGFDPDNRTFPVHVNVTNDPIVQLSSPTLNVVTAKDLDAPVLAVVLTNRGNGTLTVSDVAAETTTGGDWLSAAVSEGLSAGEVAQAGSAVYLVTAKKDGLEPGLYTGKITFTSNAANSPSVVPVTFEVQAQKAPEVLFRGVVNGATFSQNQPLAPGAIVSLFGDQLSYEVAAADKVPLATELATTKVMIGNIAAPLFFVSWGQINFQVPNEVPAGATTVQVVHNGQSSNRISAMVSGRTSGIFLLNPVYLGSYGAILNASQGNNFPIPRDLATSLGLAGAPARPGDVITIYATGLGAVSPAVGTGQAAPGVEPLARGVEIPTVNFGRPFPVRQTPSFVGLAPGFVGLYQINVEIPEQATNPRTPMSLEYPGSGLSNIVEIAIED